MVTLLGNPIWAAVVATAGMISLIAVQYFVLGIASRPARDESLRSRAFKDGTLVGASWVVEMIAFGALTHGQASTDAHFVFAVSPFLPG